MSTTQGIKLDDEITSRLKTLAKQRNRSAHWLMRAAIEDYLDREEKYEIEKAEDMAEYEDYLLTGNAVDNGAVLSWLNDLANNKISSWPR